MTENLYYLSRIKNGDDCVSKTPSWQAAVADFLLHEEPYESEEGCTNFTHHILLPTKSQKSGYYKPPIAKEVKITEARKILREEKFQHFSRDKRERVIQHELVQVRDNLENGRLLRKMQLEDIEELAELRRKRREAREHAYNCKTASLFGNPRHGRPTNDCYNTISVDQNIRPIRKKTESCFLEERIVSKDVNDVKIKQSKQISKSPVCANLENEKGCQTMRKLERKKDKKLEGSHYKQTPRNKLPDDQRKREFRFATSTNYDISEKVRCEQDIQSTTRNADEEKYKMDFERRVRLINKYFEHRVKKNFFCKWKEFARSKKVEKQEEKIWQDKIDVFMKRLNSLSKEKSEKVVISSNPLKGYRRKTAPTLTNNKNSKNGFNDPFQEVNDVELQKISEAVAKSASETRQKLDSRSVLSLDPSLRGRAKLIRVFTAVISKEDKEDEQKLLHFPEPSFLKEMELKQKERKERLKELREKRRIIEEEKIEQTKQKLERQLREEEEEKRRKLREFREKVRQEKIEQERRKQEWMRLKSLMYRAAQYYKNKLLTKYGLTPWINLMQVRKMQAAQAEKQNARRIKRQVLTIWKFNVDEINEEKERRAILFWRKNCLRSCLACWYERLIERYVQNQVAEDWNDYLIIKTALQKWQAFIFIEQFEYEQKWKRAVIHFKSKQVTKYLKQWMLLPQVLYLEREKEQRKQEWRQKIQEVIPDFRPSPAKKLQ